MTPSKAPKRWRDCLRSDVEWGKQRLLEDGMMLPLFVLQHKDHSITPFLCNFSGPDQKNAVVAFMSAMVIATECEGFSFLSEAWMKTANRQFGETQAEAEERVRNGPTPGESEDRKEVLMVSIVYRDNANIRQVLSETWEITRGPDGAINGFIDHALADDHKGRMIDIMTEEPVPREGVIAAKYFLAQYGAAMMDALDITTMEKET